jgi:SAM-dependent methyltransferase
MIISEGTTDTQYDRDYYSQINIAYKEGYTLETRRKKYADVINNITDNLPQPIIDLGCGPGFLVHLLREIGINAYGCDLSNYAIENSTNLAAPFVRLADLTKLPYTRNEFGSAVSFHVLEHLEEDEIDKAITEIFRVTKTRFYGIIPTKDGIIERDSRIREQILGDKTHKTIKERQWWQEKFEKQGWIMDTDLVHCFDRLRYGWVFVFNK